MAAAFNTPTAAVLFALEEVMGDLHAPLLGSVVLSSATSWMILHLVLIKEREFPHVHSDHTLDVALHRMGSNGMQELPVVSRRDVYKLEGLLALDDVLRLYGVDQSKWPAG